MSKLSKSATFHDFCESPTSRNEAMRDTVADHGGDDEDDDAAGDDPGALAQRAAAVRRNHHVTKSASATSSFANWLSLFVSKKRTHRSFIRPSMSLCEFFALIIVVLREECENLAHSKVAGFFSFLECAKISEFQFVLIYLCDSCTLFF